MPRKGAVKALSSSDSSDDDEPLSQVSKKSKIKPKATNDDDSSSESDIENYLQKADKIDLDSPFFNMQKVDNPPSFDKIESNILAGVSRLTDSESEEEHKTKDEELQDFTQAPSTSKLNFGQLHEYTKKIEEAKRHVEEYNKRKRAKEKETNIENLLALGETKLPEEKISPEETFHSSEFESCSDSEKEGWEEVEEQKDKGLVPTKNLEITVDMPNAIKKKKDVDLLATIKRRINKVRKDNQILVHKVHLLCWLAHGNYVSAKINSQNVLGVALSLLPSEKCYPASRTDLSYLEQVLKWFRNTVINVEKEVPENKKLDELLEAQITKKAAYNKHMLVYIFVAIMRSLGIHCRLVLSLQVEPLRPPNSQLLSLSTKAGPSEMKSEEKQNKNVKTKSESQKVKAEEDGTKSATEGMRVQEEKKSRSSRSGNKAEDGTKSATERIIVQEEKRSRSSRSGNSNVKLVEDKVRPEEKTVKAKTSIRGKSTSEDVKNQKKAPAAELKVRRNTRAKSTSEVPPPKKESAKIDTKKKPPAIKVQMKEPKKDKETNLKTTPTRSLRNQKKSTIPQVDGAHDATPTPPKPNLKKLKQKQPPCLARNHPKRLKNVTKYRDSDSEDDFVTTRSPFSNKSNDSPRSNGPNLNKPKAKISKSGSVSASDKRNDSPQTNGVNLKKLRSHVSKSEKVVPVAGNSADSPKTDGVNLKKLRSHVSKGKGVDVREDVVKLVKKSIKQQRDIEQTKIVKKRKSGQDSDDSDYVPVVVKKRRESEDDFSPKIKVKRRVQVKPDPKDEKVKKKKGVDVWAEVFLETEEKWISVDVVKGQVHCVNELFTRASHPVAYIVAWNNDNTLKDITRRYCTNFNTVTRKLRIDTTWWDQALKPFMGSKTARDREEDDELERQQLEKPLPTTIAEYKNHPLYVLKRHLLKYEALYPPNPPTLGFVRNEAVYSRQCVYTLHSRDIWLKHAKVVKPGEQPYKIVKARPRWDKLSSSIVTGELLEVFGVWQTQDYDPPTAENGIVPRNAFGNVELFKSCMLPKKTVHLKLPGLNKVAKKLNIDCAPALVGFDFHGGWNHPTYDGFVVCEEHADILVAAWDMEQDEIEKREQEKIDKRVYTNWRKLIRGLLIRERLKAKYEFGEPSGGSGKKKALPKLSTNKKKV